MDRFMGMLGKDVLHLQGKLKLQQLCVAGSSVAEELGIIGISLDGLTVMFHSYGVVSCGKQKMRLSSYKFMKYENFPQRAIKLVNIPF